MFEYFYRKMINNINITVSWKGLYVLCESSDVETREAACHDSDTD